MTYFDHVSKTWLVGKIAQCTHDQAYLIETEVERLLSCNRCDICRSHLTFVPNLPKPHPKPQSVKAEKSNQGSAPVGVQQENANCPTARCHVKLQIRQNWLFQVILRHFGGVILSTFIAQISQLIIRS